MNAYSIFQEFRSRYIVHNYKYTLFFILLTLLDSAMFLSQTIKGGGFTIDWKLYSGDTLRAMASVLWMKFGLGFVNQQIFFFNYSDSESAAVIVWSN